MLPKWEQTQVNMRRRYFSESGHTTVTFLVYGVGCVTIRLTATLCVAGRATRLTRDIPLACGE